MIIPTCKQKIYMGTIFNSICILFGLIVLIPFLWNILKLVDDYGIGFGLLLSAAGIVLCILWLWLLFVLFLAIRLSVKILDLSIRIENNSITINHNNREWQIAQEKIKYVLAGNTGTMLVWDNEGEIKTFFAKKSYFTKNSYSDLMSLLSKLSGYYDDTGEKEKIRKKLGLNHIFRKNKLESEL